MRNPGWTCWRASAALAHLMLGNAAKATEFANEALTRARAFGAPRPLGIALRTLGLVEGGERGLIRVREAADGLEQSPARLEYARTLCELGSMLSRQGRRAEARDPLRRALRMARSRGATALAEQAYELLAATGARPRKILYTGLDSLTPSERRIARMAGQGMSNREIAQALFLTIKPVEAHLSHAYQRLDITSREQLPTALTTTPALDDR